MKTKINIMLTARLVGSEGAVSRIADMVEMEDDFTGDAVYNKYEHVNNLYINGKKVPLEDLKFKK